ncbi:MAG: ATP-binding cassette domain-containing protein [Chthoniobacterales bacterium]
MAIISIQGLVVRRGKTQILTGLDWEVKEREHWVILGGNGSGKTTLLSCITGYVTPSRGKLFVLGRQYGKSDWRELRKEVGLVTPRIGRALMARYKILILDEPCSELDPVAREKFLQFLARLAESKQMPNLLFVTHHVEEILPCFGAALVLRDGAVLAQGPIGKVVITSVLSEAFDSGVVVRRNKGRFHLELA